MNDKKPLNLNELVGLQRKACPDKLLDNNITVEEEAKMVRAVAIMFPIYGTILSACGVDLFSEENRFKDGGKK